MATVMIRDVPDRLWHQIKVAAARRGWTVKRYVITALRNSLNPNEQETAGPS